MKTHQYQLQLSSKHMCYPVLLKLLTSTNKLNCRRTMHYHRSSMKASYNNLHNSRPIPGIQIQSRRCGIRQHHLHNRQLFISMAGSRRQVKFNILTITLTPTRHTWLLEATSNMLVRIILCHSRHLRKLLRLLRQSVRFPDLVAERSKAS